MQHKHPRMKLSLEEERFLKHWMYDEVHYREGQGPAKRLRLQHRAVPADLSTIIPAAFPDAAEREAAGDSTPPVDPPIWPWTEMTLRMRVAEATAAVVGKLEKV